MKLFSMSHLSSLTFNYIKFATIFVWSSTLLTFFYRMLESFVKSKKEARVDPNFTR